MTEAIEEFVRSYFSRHELELWALGSSGHRGYIEEVPYGMPARYMAAELNRELVQTYMAANRQAFSGPLALPGWVLTDLYLLPGIVGLLVGSADRLKTRWPMERLPDGRVIVAAYYAAPSVTPGLFIGVSLLSCAPGIGAGSMVKALTLRMNHAVRLRGVSAWSEAAIRAHVKVGPLRLLSKTPGPHEHEQSSFVYETSVASERALLHCLTGQELVEPSERVPLEDQNALDEVLARVARGESLSIIGPGVDDAGRVCLAADVESRDL